MNQSDSLKTTAITKAREKSHVQGAVAMILLLIGWKSGGRETFSEL